MTPAPATRPLATSGFEFRATTQPALLRKIAEFLTETNNNRPAPSFLLSVTFDLREEDLEERLPYTAVIHLDGPTFEEKK